MLSKLSVKKPYTVVVGIVLVILLGFVSFTNMTTDLLPNINLPYAMIMTTYVGASPEMVETAVTKPIEQAMATVSNIENIQSISSENSSMVILQFAQTTDMDSVSLEMRENLDQIKGYWSDGVSNPIIIKMNPDMMPIMVAAVQKSGLEGAELTDYVDREVMSDMESLEGVASVSSSGAIEQSVEVVIRQEKIDAANQKIQNALNGTFADAQAELDDAKAQLEEGKAQLQDGQNQFTEGISQGSQQISQAQGELNSGAAQISANLSTITLGLQTLQTARDAIVSQIASSGLTEEMQAQIENLKTQATQMEESIAQLDEAIQLIQIQLENPEITEEEKAGLEEQLQQLMTQRETAQTALTQYQQSITQIESAAQQAQSQLQDSLSQMDAQIAQLQSAQSQLQAMQSQLSAGQLSIAQAQAEMSKQQISATIEMAAAKAQFATGEAQLEQGQSQLDIQKESALESADLSKQITSDMVSQILTAQNFSMPAGYVTEEGIQYLVRVGDKISDTDELQNLILFDMDIEGVEPIRLSDVAEVTVTDNSSEVYASVNGKPGIVLTVQKQTGYSTGEVSDRLKAYLEKLETNDEEVNTTVLMDQGIYIDLVVNSVIQNMIFGGILAIIILLLFLRDLRPTAVVACSIPISIFASIVLMYFSGVTLNIISLSGLALGVGMLVDNSIVVIENIYRMRNEGVPPRKAAVEGAKQVGGAIIASTLTTVCVFAPIVFTEGITRQLFVDMGLTIAYSLLSSLVVALTLVPMMSAGLLKNTAEKEHKLFDKIQNAYGKIMPLILRFKVIVLLGGVVLLVLGFVAAMSRGTAFMPEMESTQTTVNLTMPEGSSMEETAQMADSVAEKIMTIDDVVDIGAMGGGTSLLGMGSSSDTTTATLYVLLKEDKKLNSDELVKTIQEKTKDLECELSIETSSMDMSALGGSGVSVEIKGKELDTLQNLAQEVSALVEKVEGTKEVSDGLEETSEELRIVVDKAKASQHNLTVAQVYQQISAKIADGTKSTTLSTESKDYDVTVINGQRTTYTREDVKGFTLTSSKMDGTTEEIPATDIVEFVDSQGLQAINRDAQTRYISVTAQVADGYNVGLVSQDVQKALKNVELPDGYTIKMTGEDETIQDSMVQLLKMLGLAVVFMYLIMVAQFQSLLSPFIVMFTIPLAFTGGLFALFFTGNEVSVIAMIGFVMLSGIIVNNGIVLVDYTNQLRAEGMRKKDALIEAGKTRMRPIMMTALTTILGLSTMAMGFGMGADMVQPMAIVTIGGLIYGTLLTLFVVPCIYDLLNRKKYKVIKIEDEE